MDNPEQIIEPLLGFDRYAALRACLAVEDVQSRVRNMSLLVRETPGQHK